MTEVPGELRDTPATPAWHGGSRISPVVRITGLALGFALAVAATLAVFLTENAVHLRLAVIAVAWAFVIAAFSAGRRRTDQAVAEGRENELRQAYALELEREVAARREYELKLENQLRRETQEAMRAELDKLRADLASLAGLRDQLSGLGELRADMGRLRAELTEQLSGEMLVERIVMRTQSIRMPSERTELGAGVPLAIDGTLQDWTDAPPTPPAEPLRTEALRTEALRTEALRTEALRTEALRDDLPRDEAARTAPARPSPVADRPAVPTPAHRVDEPAERLDERPTGRPSPVQPVPTAEQPVPTAEQPRVVVPQVAVRPVAVPPVPEPDPAPRPEPESAPHAPATALWDTPAGDERPHRRRAPEEPLPPPAEPLHEPDVYETAGHQRLTEILAESGSTVGGRRRRRYREDDGEDDVLARVLGS